jgi:hypothetical protein
MYYKSFEIKTAKKEDRWQAQIRKMDGGSMTCRGASRDVFVTPDAPTEDYAIALARSFIDAGEIR